MRPGFYQGAFFVCAHSHALVFAYMGKQNTKSVNPPHLQYIYNQFFVKGHVNTPQKTAYNHLTINPLNLWF